ncbi:hypothetical protein Pfo_004008 [Paulownia fortunei]|nr:hypothetical protein Pfo_004008 [Paulownia fortunei]
MEATKERKEQMEKEDYQQQGDKDPMAKAREVIREAIICKSDYGEADSEKNGASATDKHNAKKPEDLLAYSRAVHHTDSSLE